MTQSESQEKTCIVLIGSSGCGKSTLTNLLSKANVKTSKESGSCTKECSIFDIDSKTTLMDTPGFEDTHKSFSDTDIIKDMTTQLGLKKSPFIKIIWCIRPNQKQTPGLQLQARLINALGNKIWSSVIIVCRKADMDDPDDNWQGAKEAALKYCSSFKFCLGITNLNAMSDKVQQKYKKRNINDRQEDGYYFSDEIPNLIFNTLNKIPYTKAKLVKIFHHKTKSLAHYGYWSSTAISRQVKKYKTACPGCDRSIDRFSCIRSTGSSWYCHTSGCHRKINKGDTFYHCWPCCDRSSHSNDRFVIGCRGLTCTSCVDKSYWTTEYESAYTCCLSKSSTGCVTECCHKNPHSKLTEKCGKITYDPQGL